jgi:hypothetical protein
MSSYVTRTFPPKVNAGQGTDLGPACDCATLASNRPDLGDAGADAVGLHVQALDLGGPPVKVSVVVCRAGAAGPDELAVVGDPQPVCRRHGGEVVGPVVGFDGQLERGEKSAGTNVASAARQVRTFSAPIAVASATMAGRVLTAASPASLDCWRASCGLVAHGRRCLGSPLQLSTSPALTVDALPPTLPRSTCCLSRWGVTGSVSTRVNAVCVHSGGTTVGSRSRHVLFSPFAARHA